MKNANNSAYPLDLKGMADLVEKGLKNGTAEEEMESVLEKYIGLTKRERFAMAALESGMSPTNTHKVEETATWCVEQADALLEELEK